MGHERLGDAYHSGGVRGMEFGTAEPYEPRSAFCMGPYILMILYCDDVWCFRASLVSIHRGTSCHSHAESPLLA